MKTYYPFGEYHSVCRDEDGLWTLLHKGEEVACGTWRHVMEEGRRRENDIINEAALEQLEQLYFDPNEARR